MDERVLGGRAALAPWARGRALSVGAERAAERFRMLPAFHRHHGGDEIARLVHQSATRFQIELWQFPPRGPQRGNRVANGFGVAIERGRGLFGREVLIVQPRAGSESAAEIQILDGRRPEFLGLERERHELPRGDRIPVGIENERADVAMQSVNPELGHGLDAAHDLEQLAVVSIEPELRPHGLLPCGQVDAQPDRQRLGASARHPGEREKFVQIIHLNERALGDRALEIRAFLVRAIEDDLVSADAIVPGLLVLKTGNHLRDRTLLMKHPADRVQIVRLVGPGELDVRVAPGKGAVRLAVLFAQRVFGIDEKRRAVVAHEIGHGHAVDFGATGRGAQAEGIYRAAIEALDGGADVGAASHGEMF